MVELNTEAPYDLGMRIGGLSRKNLSNVVSEDRFSQIRENRELINNIIISVLGYNWAQIRLFKRGYRAGISG
jgi:hypothetical protein